MNQTLSLEVSDSGGSYWQWELNRNDGTESAHDDDADHNNDKNNDHFFLLHPQKCQEDCGFLDVGLLSCFLVLYVFAGKWLVFFPATSPGSLLKFLPLPFPFPFSSSLPQLLFLPASPSGRKRSRNVLCCGYTCTISKPPSQHNLTCFKSDGSLVWFLSLSLWGSGY